WIIDRNGYNVTYLPRVKGEERSEGANIVPMSDLGEGVIEVVVQADAFEGAGGASEFALSAQALMLGVRSSVVRDSSNRMLVVDAVNNGNEMLHGSFSDTVKGYGRTLRDTMHGDTFSMPLMMHKGDGALW